MVYSPEISVAIILVNWNGLEFTQACLRSLAKVDYPNFKIIVVDNGSDENEGEKLKHTFPEIDLIQSEKNLGFSGGNNLGIRKAMEQGFSHVLLLNNDTEVEPDFLGELIRAANKYPDAGIIQPLILFLHNPREIWSAGGKWIPAFSRSLTLGDREPLADYRIKSPRLDWATGCAMLVSVRAIEKAGLLNEQFFVYFEDVEWSLRIRKASFSIYLEDQAKIYHEAGASSKKQHAEGTLSPKVFYYHVRNQFLLIRTLGKNKGLSSAYHLGRFSLWMVYFLARGRFTKLKAVAKGIRDGLREPLISGSWL
ncbi:glycosyltransferase family 2 protein [Algoriphagus sanaruensis]|uniref:Rhamnosyl transferase n=1 Tax=Algoriphagus sanaruensis TaxID=1727163 RepID=A0A142EJN9_9BACT|nr:glycosyltransferase family 2 protein [Algoriphagus sanaruensis]AMQ55344.1 rhamnosyl transferase [Algoriphagus sanaruensis]